MQILINYLLQVHQPSPFATQRRLSELTPYYSMNGYLKRPHLYLLVLKVNEAKDGRTAKDAQLIHTSTWTLVPVNVSWTSNRTDSETKLKNACDGLIHFPS